MKLTKIQYFDTFGEENWVDTWTDDIKVFIKNRQECKDNDIIYNTNNHGFDIAYFYMVDHLGHTTFYRMNLEDFEKYWWSKDRIRKVKE